MKLPMNLFKSFAFSIAGVKKSSFEEKNHVLYSIGGSVFTSIVVLCFGLFRVYTWFQTKETLELVGGALEILMSVILLINLVLTLFLFRLFVIYHFLWMCIGQTILIVIHCTSGRGFNSTGLLISLFFLIWTSIFYSRFTFIFIFLDCFVLLFFYIFDLFVDPLPLESIKSAQIMYFIAPYIISLFIFVTMYFKNQKETQNLLVVRNVTNIIKSLNFSQKRNQEVLKKFSKINTGNAPEFLISFKTIIDKITEYRSYLPMTLIEEDGSGDDNDDDDDDENESRAELSSDSTSKSSGNSYSSFFSNNSLMSNESEKIRNRQKLIKKQKSYKIGERRVISYMIIRISEFDLLINKMSDEELSLFHELYLSLINEIVTEKRGKIIDFNNDIVFIAFNVFKKTVDHQANCCKAAIDIIERIKNHKTKKITNISNSLCISITSSLVLLRNWGISSIKRFNMIGKCINFNNYLSNQFLEDHYSFIPGRIIIDQNVHELVKYHFQSHIIDYSKKYDSFIFHLIRSKNLKETVEWNYTLNDELNKDSLEDEKQRIMCEAWNYCKNEQFEQSKSILDQYKQKFKDFDKDEAYNNLQCKMSSISL